MNFLFLVVLFPLLGFILLTCFQQLFSKYTISVIGVSSIALSAIVTSFVAVDFFIYIKSTNNTFFIQHIFTWISIFDFSVPVSFRIDNLSLSMLIMITWVSFFVHLYASWYMFNDISYSRFFSYMNLFVANMLVLVLADNLLLMYLGWEGVGLCSYLLIGFYHSNLKNSSAALKSFIMTRVGDMFLICAIFMLYKDCHTLDFYALISMASEEDFHGSQYLITLCLLVAALAKSGQLPLQTWLSDAMVAPVPASALIHAATMVTAGVYLIVRTYSLFVISPGILYLVGVVGSITLIISSCSALVHYDIKKILAYSTMSQIGYMFIALSVQAWESAIFHLTMHSFCKALLFLASGSLIFIFRGEQNIFKMHVSYKSMPLIYFSFLIGGSSLSALPIITSGFYSKGEILWNTLFTNNFLFMAFGMFGSFLTSLYTFRVIFVIFHNDTHNSSTCKYINSFAQSFPLLILLILSTAFGTWVRVPLLFNKESSVCNLHCFNYFIFECFLNIFVISGLCLSIIYYFFSYRCLFFSRSLRFLIRRFFLECCYSGWGVDWIYKKVFIKPYLFITRWISFDPISVVISNFFIFVISLLSVKLILYENGQLSQYVMSMILGVVIIFFILIFL